MDRLVCRSKWDCRSALRVVCQGIGSLLMFGAGLRADGVAVLKEQSFHRDVSAKAVAYRQMLTHGPYLRLVTFRGNLDLVPSKLADWIEFPGPPAACLMEERDVLSIRKARLQLERFGARYPASAPLIKPEIEVLSGYLGRFASGEVRFEGRWMARNEVPQLLESRKREAEARVRHEVEQVIADEAREDMGLVRMDGDWVSKELARERPPAAGTQLSAALWPLIKPDLDGARRALQNLAALAATQSGATKVRTERVHAVIRNLFAAEFQLSRQMIAGAVAEAQAVQHDRQARLWSQPNAFGTRRDEAALDSRNKAKNLRQNAGVELELRRAHLLDQLHEMEGVAWDFFQLRENRVALLLAETVRAVAARRFSPVEFQSTFSDEALAGIRSDLSASKSEK